MSTAQIQQVAYGLTQALIGLPQQTILSKRNPTSSDKAQIGTTWINEISNTYYVLTSITNNNSNWVSTSIGNGNNGQLLIGGGVAPVWANLTAGSGITIVNGVNSITLSASGSVATTLNADSGSATFSGGAATIAGGSNISTSAAVHTLTVNLVNSPSVSGSITAGTGITSTTGNIAASSGNVSASGTVTGGTGLIASTGGVVTTGINQFHSLGAGVMQTSSTGVITSTEGTDGQVLISSSVGAPAWSTLTAGSNVTITNGHNTITIAAAGGSGGTVSQLSGNAGVATPDGGGNINVIGSGNITVTGDNVHTLTATLTGTTNHAVQVGNSGGSVTSLTVGTDGQVLVGASAANPAFITPTADTGLTITTNSTTLKYGLTIPVVVSSGGTGSTTLTQHGVLVGEGTSPIMGLTVGTNGQVLLGSTGANPAFGTLTSSGGTLAYTTGAASLNIDAVAGTTSQAGVLVLASNAETIAGTNTTKATTPDDIKAKLGVQTSNAVPYGAGTAAAVSWTSAATNGQVLIGATSAAPAFGSITSTGGTVVISTGANSLNLEVAGTIPANIINLPNTNSAGTVGEIQFNSVRWVSNYGTLNTFVGASSGNTSLTTASSTNSTCVGYLTGNSLTTARDATLVGSLAGSSITAGVDCVAIGSGSLQNFTSGTASAGANVSIGTLALNQLSTGIFNIAIGSSAGINYTTSESSNIIIGSTGQISESNVIRIGSNGSGTGQQNKAFIAGVYNTTPGATQNAVIIDSNGQMGGIPFSSGSWTPALNFGGSSTGITYSTRSGQYLKIGTLVFINWNMTLTSKGSSSGDAQISGMPYSVSIANTNFLETYVVSVTFPGTVTYLNTQLLSGTPDQLQLIGYESGGSRVIMQDTAFINSSVWRGSGCYISV